VRMEETKIKKQSQDEVVLNYLKQPGKTITTSKTFSLFGIIDLQSVIRNLRKKIAIQDTWIKKIDKEGKTTRYKEYWIKAA